MKTLNSKICPKGEVTFKLIGPDGKVKLERTEHNLIVTTGCAMIASILSNETSHENYPSHMRVGEGTTEEASGDTGLETPITGGYAGFTKTTRSGATITYEAKFDAHSAISTDTWHITEMGIFNGEATEGVYAPGTMMNRTTFDTVSKGPADIFIVSWQITIQ